MSNGRWDLRDLERLQHGAREVTLLFQSPKAQSPRRGPRSERRRKRVESVILTAFYLGLCLGLCSGFLLAYAAITWRIGG